MTYHQFERIKYLIKTIINKFTFTSKKPKLIIHALNKKAMVDAQLWQCNSNIQWAKTINYPLLKNEELNSFEQLDRNTLLAEYAVCYEISMSGGIILDNGCGMGRHIQVLMESRYNNIKKIIGVDIGKQLLENAQKILSGKKNYSDKIELHLASIENLSFISNRSLDFAICMYRTFGNFSKRTRDKNIKEIKKKLKKGGIYILSIGNRKYQKKIIDHYKKFDGPPKMYNHSSGNVVYGDGISSHYYTKDEIRSYFHKKGFTIKRLYEAGTNFIVWLFL